MEMEPTYPPFISNASDETKKAMDKFIQKIHTGAYAKRILPNHYEEYPLDAAAKSFKSFAGDEGYLDLILGKEKTEDG